MNDVHERMEEAFNRLGIDWTVSNEYKTLREQRQRLSPAYLRMYERILDARDIDEAEKIISREITSTQKFRSYDYSQLALVLFLVRTFARTDYHFDLFREISGYRAETEWRTEAGAWEVWADKKGHQVYEAARMYDPMFAMALFISYCNPRY